MTKPLPGSAKPFAATQIVMLVWMFLLLCQPATLRSQIAFDEAKNQFVKVADIKKLPSKIAFGSCSNQNKPQPVLNTIVKQEPDLFIYLGDNIYGDTKDMKVLESKYRQLGEKKEFQNLRFNVPGAFSLGRSRLWME